MRNSLVFLLLRFSLAFSQRPRKRRTGKSANASKSAKEAILKRAQKGAKERKNLKRVQKSAKGRKKKVQKSASVQPGLGAPDECDSIRQRISIHVSRLLMFRAESGLQRLDCSRRLNFGDGLNAASRRARFQTPSSVSFFLALTKFRGESSVSSSWPIICVPKRTHRVFRRTHRVCHRTQ